MKSIRALLATVILAVSAASAHATDVGVLSTSLSSIATKAASKNFWEVISFTVDAPSEVFAQVSGVGATGSWTLLDDRFKSLSGSYALGSYDFFSLAAGDYLLGISVKPLFGEGYALAALGVTPAVPEPETYALFLAGIGMIITISRRRLRR
jgi:hypothetical protein